MITRSLYVVAISLAGLNLCPAASGDTITVCLSGCDFSDLWPAIQSAQEGDIIEVDDSKVWESNGCQNFDPNNPCSDPFTDFNITIRGSVDDNGRPSTKIYKSIYNLTTNVVFENIQFGVDFSSEGFAFQIEGCDPSYTNCVFYNSNILRPANADDSPASIVIAGASPLFTDCEFRSVEGISDSNMGRSVISILVGNQSGSEIPSSPTLTNCRFIDCKASDTGVIFCRSGGTFLNCVFESNFTGSAVFYVRDNRELLIKGCSFIGNFGSLVGCAIYLSSSSNDVTIESCQFNKNYTVGRGGAIYSAGAYPEIKDCTFTGNLAENGGGAIFCTSGGLNLTNCEFSSNFPDSITGPFSTTPPVSLIGDVNGDGIVDHLDVVALNQQIGICQSDLNGDGLVNGEDLTAMLAQWGISCAP